MFKIFFLKLPEAKLGQVRDWLAGNDSAGREADCGEGCYELADGTQVPLGDLGIAARPYRLKS